MRTKLQKVILLAAALLLSTASGCMPAETCRVILYGIVSDAATGIGIEGVRVFAVDFARSDVSGPDGSFELPAVIMKPGAVKVGFEKEGFVPCMKEAPVSRSARIGVDATLMKESGVYELVSFSFTTANEYVPGPAPLPTSPVVSRPAVRSNPPVEAKSVVVYPKGGSLFSETAKRVEEIGSEVVEADLRMGFMLVDVPDGVSADELSERISAEGWAEGAEPDHICFTAGGFVPDDPLWPLQWGPMAISMPRAWNIDAFLSPVVVAVLDTGVDVTHPDLSGICLPMLNSINANMLDNDGHGTHVAGTIAASVDNGVGIAGISGRALLLPVKALEYNGFVSMGTMSSISRGIRLAADNGADVINMSIGWPLFFPDYMFRLLKEAIDYADSMGIALVAAAGNDASTSDLSMPGKYSKCFAVSAVDSYLYPAAYANTGPGIDIFAPGGGGGSSGIISTVPYAKYPFGYAKMSGTSMATPHISGLFALLLGSGLTAREAADAITSSCRLVEGQQVGLADAYGALSGARGGRALFWLSDAEGGPLTFSFRGADGSRDVSVWGSYAGDAYICGWMGLAGEDYPAQGDFFGKQAVTVTPSGTLVMQDALVLEYVDLEDAGILAKATVPPER